MSTFQRLLQRFLGQMEDSYTPTVVIDTCSTDSPNSSQRTESLSKVFQTRRQRSLEVLKTASCFSCGIDEQDRHPSADQINTLTSIVRKKEYNLESKAMANQLVDRSSGTQPSVKTKRRAKTKLIIIRHGERVDALFGDSWFDQAFDQTGNYHRFHSNLPISLPHRQRFKDYLFDPPLTELGLIRSYRTGEALCRVGLHVDYCYSSPSLRCIQTADAILNGMKLRTLIPIRIELGLFECGAWHKGVVPHFMSINELILNRLNIETSYNSIQKSLSTDENEYDYYERSNNIVRQILSKHETNDANILFIGHAPSLETLTRQLVGGQPRPNELAHIAQKINYLSLTILEGRDESWTFVDTILSKTST